LILCVYVFVVYAWMCEYMKVLMCGCMNVWMYECDLNDHINYIWEVTRWNETGHVRLEADWQHSTNTRQIPWSWYYREQIGPLMVWNWHTVAANAPWEASSLSIEGLGEVTICKWEQSVLPSACFSSHFLFCLWKSLTFAWTTLSGFQSIWSILFFVSLLFAWTALSGFQSTGTLSIS